MVAALFGNGSSVYAYARLSYFLEAAQRRLIALLWIMYVDDGQLTEPCESGQAGQTLVQVFFEYMGMSLSPEKSQRLSREGVFLGIAHDPSTLVEKGYVLFWPKPEIILEIQDMFDQQEKLDRCTPADASGFVAYWDSAPWHSMDTSGEHTYSPTSSASTPIALHGRYPIPCAVPPNLEGCC